MLSIIFSIILPVYLLKKMSENSNKDKYLYEDVRPWIYGCLSIGISSLFLVIVLSWNGLTPNFYNRVFELEIVNFITILLLVFLLRPNVYDYLYFPIISFLGILLFNYLKPKIEIKQTSYRYSFNKDYKKTTFSDLEKIYNTLSK